MTARSRPLGRLQTQATNSVVSGRLDTRTTGVVGPTVTSYDTNIGRIHMPNPPITARDLGISAVSGNGTQVLYIFGDTFLTGVTPVDRTNGEGSLRYSTAAIGSPTAAPASMTSLINQFDANGAPLEFISPVLPEEPDGRGGELRRPFWADSVFPHPTGTGWIVYYQRVRTEVMGGEFYFTPDQVCVIDVPLSAGTVSRTGNEVVVMNGWEGMSSGCCLGTDGFIYLYTQTWLATIQHYCARVPYASYKNPASYTYWNGSGWSADRTQRQPVVLAGDGYDGLAGMGGITVTWNAYLGKYVMVHTYAKIPAQHLCLRTATAPQGPFSRITKLDVPHGTLANDPYGIYTGREHKWAQKDNGRVIYTSHWRPTSLFNGELRLTEIKFGPDPTIPTNVVTPPAEGWSVKISNDLDATPVGGTYTLASGIYELDMRNHPQNAAYRTCITVPNGRTFDFSQAELRLKPGQQRVTVGGVTSGQQSSIISNKFLGSTSPLSNRAEDITIIVGCLNGNAVNQGAGTASVNQQDADQSWMDGIELRNPANCKITGSATSPWARTVSATYGNGTTLNVDIRGVIKNIRGWDGGGGNTETFYYTFDLSRGGNVAEYLELAVDDGSLRTATGWSSNGAHDASDNTTLNASVNAFNPSVVHRFIYSHGLKSHGGTSWHDCFVSVQDSITEQQNAAGFRFEYGWGHTVFRVVSQNTAGTSGSHNGLNLKGEPSPPGGSVMLTATDLTIRNVEHGVQVNSIVGANLQGWCNWDSAGGRQKINQVDALYGNRASTGIVTTNFLTI